MNTDLKRLSDLLFGINYQVFLRDYTVDLPISVSVLEILEMGLGAKAEFGRFGTATPDEALTEIQKSIDYVGDESSGPLKDKTQSKEFLKLRTEFLKEIAELAATSSEILSFWFKSGHPAYPVFWDFAFVFRKSEVSIVLIGSSSD